MAFEFPDPTITPEFTAQNGVTYKYDFDKELWHVQVVEEKMTPMKVKPKFKSLSHLTYHEDYYGSNSYKCYKHTGSSTYSIKLAGITRFAGRNPETNRIIVITDKSHLSWSDDEGVTWQTNTESSRYPAAWNMYQGSDSYFTGYHEDHGSPWVWCGGKRWMSFNTSWCRIAWTDNDFENVYLCRFNPHNLGGPDDKPPKSYRYCEETDELWWLMSDGYVLKIDPDISKWMDSVKNTIGQYGFNPALPSNMPGVLKRKKLVFKRDEWTDTSTGRYFDCMALSPHGTKVAWSGGGVCFRTENNFDNYTYANVAGHSYDHRVQDLNADKVEPNSNYRQITDCYYVRETGVWIACGMKDLYVSFDDAKTWQGVDYRSVASAYDVAQTPYIYRGSSVISYYGYTNLSNYVGYTKGMYLYQSYEMTIPQFYYHLDRTNGTSPYENYTYEKVLYCSADLKNWTKTVLPTSKETYFNCGPFTFLEDREAFLSGYGYGENEKTKNLVYFDSYI